MSTITTECVLVRLQGQVMGPYSVTQLRRLKGFTGQTLVSYPGSDKWAPAFRVLNMNAYEPPIAGASGIGERWIEWSPPTLQAASPVFDWKAKHIPGEWVDRWLSRVLIFNVFLAVAAFGAWSYPPVRIPLEQELLRQADEQWRQWKPVILARLHLPQAPSKLELARAKSFPAVGRNPAKPRVVRYQVSRAKTQAPRKVLAKIKQA